MSTQVTKAPKTAMKWVLGSGAVVTAVIVTGVLLWAVGKKKYLGQTMADAANAVGSGLSGNDA